MDNSKKKLKARDEFIHFAEELLGEKFGKLNAVQQSHALTHFYVKEIHNRNKSEISDEDLELAIVDGSSDLGCDLIHRDDKHVLIIQSKYRGHGGKEPADGISHFQAILKRLTDPSLKANSRLLDQISTIDWKNDSFEMVYLSFGAIDNQARKITLQQPHYPDSVPDLDQRCVWTYLDETNLNEELRNKETIDDGGSPKPITFYPIGQKGKRGASVIEVEAGEFRSFIMALEARQLVQAYLSSGRDAIFSLNIRNFVGSTGTNKAIIKSAKEVPEQFFLFNNGISCLCTKLDLHENRVEVIDLQVINGAQTIKSLVHSAGGNRPNEPDPWSIHQPKVLVRITEIPQGYGKVGRIREQITQFNNTQNTVKVSDFRSNDTVQQHLKDQFKKLHRRGRQVFYMPKRTDVAPKNSEVVRLEEFAKSVYAFLADPTLFSGATAFLFNDDAGGGYNTVFLDANEKMPEDEFRLRAAIYWLAQEFGNYMREDREQDADPDTKAALERKWLLLFATRKVFEYYFPKDAWRKEVQKLYKGDWELGKEERGLWLMRIYKDAKAGLAMSYKNSKNWNPNFVHRNWMRSKETPGVISDTLRTAVLSVREPIGPVPN